MFKLYNKYIIKIFLLKFTYISLIFFSLIIILGILEEISFFKSLNKSFIYPYLFTFLNAPITLFEIFPFIFLLTTQFFFYELFKNNELDLLKRNGLSNLKIINIIFLISIFIGIFNIVIYYNLASKLKFSYSILKNKFSNDNKYLAMVNDSGLWIKDEIDNKILIVKSSYIDDTELSDTIINEFNKNFELLRIIQSNKIDIKNNKWIIFKPTITINNNSETIIGQITLNTNFDSNKINNLFSNISTLDVFMLFNLKKDFEKLGYSTNEIRLHLLEIFTVPLNYGLLTILSAIIMFNYSKNRSLLFNIILGILMSVLIYYVKFIFESLGVAGKIPINLSIFFPLVFFLLSSVIGLVSINEK